MKLLDVSTELVDLVLLQLLGSVVLLEEGLEPCQFLRFLFDILLVQTQVLLEVGYLRQVLQVQLPQLINLVGEVLLLIL